MSPKPETLDKIGKHYFNSPSELLTFSAEILRKTKHPEKRQFVREKMDAFLVVSGCKFKIADISVSGLKLEETLLTKKDQILSAKIICIIGENIFCQKTILQVASNQDEVRTRFTIVMNIGLPERMQSIETGV